jgi:hypothetical protein
MALYEDGKIRFSDEFIESFKSESVKDFLRVTRFNLVDNKNSPYCTIENLLYNWKSHEISTKLYWYLMGKKNATRKNCIEMQVSSIAESHELIDKLKEIEKKMKEENDW